MQDPKHKVNSNKLHQAWLSYALSKSEAIPLILKQLEKETYQKVLQPRMLSSPLQGRLLSLLSLNMQLY